MLSWLADAGILALFTLALTWVAAIAGLFVKTVDGASTFSYPISIVEAIRALLLDQPVSNDIWVALAWCVGIMLVAYIFAMRVYKNIYA